MAEGRSNAAIAERPAHHREGGRPARLPHLRRARPRPQHRRPPPRARGGALPVGLRGDLGPLTYRSPGRSVALHERHACGGHGPGDNGGSHRVGFVGVGRDDRLSGDGGHGAPVYLAVGHREHKLGPGRPGVRLAGRRRAHQLLEHGDAGTGHSGRCGRAGRSAPRAVREASRSSPRTTRGCRRRCPPAAWRPSSPKRRSTPRRAT